MLNFTNRDKIFIGAVYIIPTAVLAASLAMAFTHAKDWASRHNNGAAWEHWAFAAMIELPALLGLLLMTLWPKIGGGRKPTTPRFLFLAAAILSLLVQQAYAGSDASWSTRIVAGVPSVVAGVFLEILFWVLGLIDEAKKVAATEATETAERETRQALGLGDIAPPPTLTPPPMSPPTRPDITAHLPAMSPRHQPTMSPDTTGHVTPTPTLVSPDIRPTMSPDTSTAPTRHVTPNVTPTQADIPQATAHVTPGHVGLTPWSGLDGMSPDTTAVADVVTIPYRPNVTPTSEAVSPDIQPPLSPDTDTDVTPTLDHQTSDTDTNVALPRDNDMSGDSDTQKLTDPRWMEAAIMRRNGATVAAIAAHFNVSSRTVTRWKLPDPDITKPANGHVPDLTGVH